MHYIPLRSISTGPSSICNHWRVNSLGIPAKMIDENKNLMGLRLALQRKIYYPALYTLHLARNISMNMNKNNCTLSFIHTVLLKQVGPIPPTKPSIPWNSSRHLILHFAHHHVICNIPSSEPSRTGTIFLINSLLTTVHRDGKNYFYIRIYFFVLAHQLPYCPSQTSNFLSCLSCYFCS